MPLQLPKYILDSLIKNKTSLGEHPSYPPDQEEAFIVNAVAHKFSELSKGIEITSPDEMKSELGRLITECKKKEKGKESALEQLCTDVVTELFSIPSDTLNLSVKLVDKVNDDNERLIPEKTDDFTFDSIKDMKYLTDEIYKRRMLDALINGASIYYSDNISMYIRELFDIDSDLPSLYKKIIKYNEILLFFEKDSISDEKKDTTESGKVDVIVNMPQNTVKIKAEGMIFPVLLEEAIKGVLELAIAQGLPRERKKAEYVIKKADFKLAEMWDMRLGMSLWDIIVQQIDNMQIVEPNFFLMTLSELPSDKFNDSLQEIFGRTARGKRILHNIIKKIISEKDKDDFNDFLEKGNGQYQISDNDYFNADELISDSYDMNLTEASDKEILISPEEAERQGFAVPEDNRKWKEGEFIEPKNIGKAYKVFYLGKDGQLYPPVIANDNAQPTPIGKWLPASSPNIIGYTLKDHRPKVQSGGKGTRGRSLGPLAFRPGWHMGEIPYAEQFLKRGTINGRRVWPKGLVWAECEYSNDVDYQKEAMSYGYSSNGKFRHAYAGLPKIPKGGSYKYRTNPNPNTVPWVIAGAMKVSKVLSYEEVDRILEENGVTPPIVMDDRQYKDAMAKQKQNNEIGESIDINPKNKGKFTATKRRTGKTTSELLHSNNELTRKRANFARMAKRHFKPLSEDDKVVAEKKKRKLRRNDKGESVPEICPDCGSKVGVFIQGEPIFKCTNKKCGRLFGIVPFPNHLK